MATYLIGRNITSLPSRSKYNSCQLPLGKKYRSHFEIIALILEAVKEGRGGRFAIMKHASVNCTQLEKFLSSLIETGLITVDTTNGRAMCKATEKGLNFLREYYVLSGMLLAPHTEPRTSAIICEAHIGHQQL